MSPDEPSAGGVPGAVAAVAAYVLWGLSALYWRLLADVPALQLFCFRIVFSLLTLAAFVAGSRQAKVVFSAVRSPRMLLVHAGSGLSVAINWAAFMWASIHGHVIETGVGYLLAPPVSVAFGVAVLRERLNRAKALAVVLMLVGIALLIVRNGDLIIWVYLTIGMTFGIFGLLRKLSPLGPVTGLAVETALPTLAVGIGAASGTVTFSYLAWGPASQVLLLCLCGLVSIIPLWLFAIASRSLRLADLGFFQYLLPTTQFVLAVTVYAQPISFDTLASLAIIWIALGIVVFDALAALRRTT